MSCYSAADPGPANYMPRPKTSAQSEMLQTLEAHFRVLLCASHTFSLYVHNKLYGECHPTVKMCTVTEVRVK